MKAISLQPRDLKLLYDLGQVVLMTVDMIRLRHFRDGKGGQEPTSDRACLRRLRLLREHGLIARISFPVVSYGNRPGHLLTIYRLTRHGADMLLARTGAGPARLLRTEPKPQTLLHRLALAQVMLAVNDAVESAKLPQPMWILEQDMRPGFSPSATRTERFILYEDFKNPDGEIILCRPDASTWLRFPATDSFHDLLIWWEIDRSTEGLDQVASKLAGYHRLLRDEEPGPDGSPQRVYLRHWPAAPNATRRVFFVCESTQRIDHLCMAIRQLPGSEFVRLTTRAQLTVDRFLAEPIWQDVKGERKAINPKVRAAG